MDNVNTHYLEAANETFEEAESRHDFSTMRIIILDLKSKGFDREAETLNSIYEKKFTRLNFRV